jgi:hypothetical protein
VGFAQDLCNLIDNEIALAKGSNRFLAKVDHASVKVTEVARYLFGTQYLISHTPGHLRLAIERAEAPDLKDYFIEHLGEEVGHDRWAQDDINILGRLASFAFKTYVSRKMVSHVAWIESELIRKDPWLYPPYILSAEYLAVSAGPWFLERLNAAGIPNKALSVVKNHAVLDALHVQQDCQIIDAFIDSNPDWQERYRQVVKRAIANYLQFLDDLVVAG